MYILTIAGSIQNHKLREFEQTYRLLLPQMPKSCQKAQIYSDLLKEDEFLFTSYWHTEQSAQDFLLSEIADTLIGAFRVLGKLEARCLGEIMNLEERVNGGEVDE